MTIFETPEKLICRIASARRAAPKDPTQMSVATDSITRILVLYEYGGVPERLMANAMYEASMLHWPLNFHTAMAFNQLSRNHAKQGDDQIGQLLCDMNSGGLFLPAYGEYEKAKRVSLDTFVRAKELLAFDPGDNELCLQCIAMNCLCHLIRHGAKKGRAPVEEVKDWCDWLEANRIFTERYKHLDPAALGPAHDLARGRAFIAKSGA